MHSGQLQAVSIGGEIEYDKRIKTGACPPRIAGGD